MVLRHRSVLLLVSGILVLSLLNGSAGPASAGDCWGEGTVPDMITIAPDGSFPYHVIIECGGNPVTGSFVEIEFSMEAMPLIAWTDPVPPGADTPVIGPGGGYLFTGVTDANGEVTFHMAGSGCVAQKNPADETEPYVAQIRADNFVMNESLVNSPDAVDRDGTLPEFLGYSVCDPATGTSTVGLADALYHTPPLKSGAVEICTNFTGPDFDDPVGLADAGLLTPYVKAGTTGTCLYVGP